MSAVIKVMAGVQIIDIKLFVIPQVLNYPREMKEIV